MLSRYFSQLALISESDLCIFSQFHVQRHHIGSLSLDTMGGYFYRSHQELQLLLSPEVMSDSFATPQTVAHQAPLFMKFPRQEHSSGLPLPSSRGSSQPRDQTYISCLPLSHWGMGGYFHNVIKCSKPKTFSSRDPVKHFPPSINQN